MKDNNNKVDYNVYSCGEYSNDNTGFGIGTDAIVFSCSDFSSIGEKSLKLIRKHALYGTTCFTRLSNLTGTNNITASVDVYSPYNPVKINLYNGSVITQVTCPASSTPTTVNLSETISFNQVDLRVFLDNVDDYCYIDNIKISY